MESFAVQIFPIAKPDDWHAFIESIETGDRSDAHRQALRAWVLNVSTSSTRRARRAM